MKEKIIKQKEHLNLEYCIYANFVKIYQKSGIDHLDLEMILIDKSTLPKLVEVLTQIKDGK